MSTKQDRSTEVTLSRRSLLMNSAKLTAGAAALCSAGVISAAVPAQVKELPEVTEEIAGHWTTF